MEEYKSTQEEGTQTIFKNETIVSIFQSQTVLELQCPKS